MPYKDLVKRREYNRIWVRKRRSDWLADKACVDCGSKENLEIDHEDPTKKVTHRVWPWAQQRRDEELAKCSVRCKFCHLKKTDAYLSKLFSRPIPHGILSGYLNHGCRCIKCKEFYSLWRKEKYQRIRK